MEGGFCCCALAAGLRAPAERWLPCAALLECAVFVFDREFAELCAFALLEPDPLGERVVGRLSEDLVCSGLLPGLVLE